MPASRGTLLIARPPARWSVTIRHVQRLSRRYREGGLAEFLCRLAGVTPRRDLFDLSQDEADDEVEHIKVPSGPLPPEVRRALFGEKSNS